MGADDNHIITRRLSVKRKYTADISDQESRISERQLNKVKKYFKILYQLKFDKKDLHVQKTYA